MANEYVIVKSDEKHGEPAKFWNFESKSWVSTLEEASLLDATDKDTSNRYMIYESYCPGPFTVVLDRVTGMKLEMEHIADSVWRIKKYYK
jgi:hypothetical protein